MLEWESMNNDTTNDETTTNVGTDTLGEVSGTIAPTELSEEVLDILPAVEVTEAKEGEEAASASVEGKE